VSRWENSPVSLPSNEIKMRNLTLKWHTICCGVLVDGTQYVVVFLFADLAYFVGQSERD
jgi:hypothetical protein